MYVFKWCKKNADVYSFQNRKLSNLIKRIKNIALGLQLGQQLTIIFIIDSSADYFILIF